MFRLNEIGMVCTLAALGVVGVPHTLDAQVAAAKPDIEEEPASSAKHGKILRALRVATTPPTIDGRLDDEAWEHAESAEGFVQWEPNNMAPLSERTAVQVAYDDRHLYVAVRCYDSEPDGVAGPIIRRDEMRGMATDLIAVAFDPRHDHLTGYSFMTNPAGVQADLSFFNDENADQDYNAVWEVRTERTHEGWTAEYSIPFSQLRFERPTDAETVWGFSVRREIHRKGESGEWTGRPRGERGAVSRWGHLVFADPPTPPRRLEWLPYVVAQRETSSTHVATFGVDGGLDLRLGLGTQSTLSATVNPDFGQVEADPAVLNLSVFETFFPEKRPFFLEDSRTFVPPFGLFQLFHSRRIGGEPSRFEDRLGDSIVEQPVQTSVLGAAKVTGKTSGWTYGALSAATAREYAQVDTEHVDATGSATVSRAEQELEPLTSYNVVRVQRDINSSSNIGGIATAVIRDGDDDALTGGIDYTMRWNRNRNEWNGHWGVTRAAASDRTDGLRTDFGGVTNFRLTRKHWGFFTHFDHFGRNFRVTDVGFHRGRVNSNQLEANIALEQPDPGKIFRRASVFVGGGQGWNDGRLVYSRFVFGGASMQFLNFWNVEMFSAHGFRALDDLDTRGGPPIVRPPGSNVDMFVSSDSRKSWRLELGLGGGWTQAGGWEARIGPSLRLQPSPRVQATLGTSYRFGRDVPQWITNEDTDGDGADDHVYGTLRRNVVDVSLRAAFAIHRDLSVQAFLQPFVAVGDYTDIRRLARPRSFEFEPTTVASDPDFSDKSLRGTVVLRWEYVRGSSLFLVWNVSTLDETRPGIFSPFRDLRTGFGAGGTHVFIFKVSYWLNR